MVAAAAVVAVAGVFDAPSLAAAVSVENVGGAVGSAGVVGVATCAFRVVGVAILDKGLPEVDLLQLCSVVQTPHHLQLKDDWRQRSCSSLVEQEKLVAAQPSRPTQALTSWTLAAPAADEYAGPR